MVAVAKCFDDHWKPQPGPLDTPCHIWQRQILRSGYGHMRDGMRKVLAHRFSWERTNGPIPDGLQVLHRCDVRACVNLDHLFLGTHAENMRDMARKGRAARVTGERHGRSSLTESDVSQIRKLYRNKAMTQYQLANLFGVRQGQISRIVNGQRWGSA